MKIQPLLLLLIVLLTTAIITNPAKIRHEQGLIDGMNQLNTWQDQNFIATCEYHNYYVFSYVAYLGKPVSFGFLGNVHVLYQFLHESMQDFYTRHHLVPYRGRGKPAYN